MYLFSWRIITLQYCGGFCHTLTWVSHVCTCVSTSRTPLPSPSLSHPSGLSQCLSLECPVSGIERGLIIYFTYSSIHVWMLFSQVISLLHSPTESECLFFTSVSLLLSCLLGHHYHLSKFHIYVLIYCIDVSLSDISLCIIGSSFIHLIRID